MDAILNKDCSFFRAFVIIFLSAAVSACGTLTGIPSHGGGKRFAVEQQLISTSIRGAIKQIDLSDVRGKTVFIQMTSVNDQGGGNISGGRASMVFALQGLAESSPVSTVTNTFKVFDLSNASRTNSIQQLSGGSSTQVSSVGNIVGSSASNTVSNAVTNGTNDSTATSTNTSNTTSNSSSDSTASTDTTTTTGGTVTTQTSDSDSTTDTTVTSTTNGSATGTTNGTSTQNTDSTANGTGTTNQSSTNASTSITSNSQNSQTSSSTSGNRQEIASAPETSETQTEGIGYNVVAGVEYKGQGNFSNFNVPVSDVGILQSIIRTYFFLNDVKITTDPNNPDIEAIVNVNVDVFGSVRSRLDTVVYNKEKVKVQTVLEVMAISIQDQSLLMLPQVGSYEASYDEQYAFWVGPLNNHSKRITHQPMARPMLVSFADEAEAKIQRQKQTSELKRQKELETAQARNIELSNIKQVLSAWVKSASNGDEVQYFATYSKSFSPEAGIEDWKKERKTVLEKSVDARILLKDIQIELSKEMDNAKVKFNQSIESTQYNEKSVKSLDMTKEGDRWLIAIEKNSE